MTKRQLIDEIVAANSTAEPAFLANFDDADLSQYLDHLRLARTPRLSGDASRYDKYFQGCPTIPAQPSQWRTTSDAAEALPDAEDELDTEELVDDDPAHNDADDTGILPAERLALATSAPTVCDDDEQQVDQIRPLFDDYEDDDGEDGGDAGPAAAVFAFAEVADVQGHCEAEDERDCDGFDEDDAADEICDRSAVSSYERLELAYAAAYDDGDTEAALPHDTSPDDSQADDDDDALDDVDAPASAVQAPPPRVTISAATASQSPFARPEDSDSWLL